MTNDEILEVLTPGFVALGEDGRIAGNGTKAEVFTGDLYVMDLEMSGPDPKQHEVLDIGGVRAGLGFGFPEQGQFEALVKPLHIGTAERGALKVVGYSSKGWKDAIALEKAVAGFTEAGKDAVIAGWGIGHDMAFLAETYERLEIPWPFAPVALDIQTVARKVLKKGEHVDRFNLGHVADRLGIGRMGEHGAFADAYATYDVLVKIFEIVKADRVEVVDNP